MGEYFRCPACHALLRKNPMDAVLSKAGGVVMTVSSPAAQVTQCPGCGFMMDRTELWAGKYDVEVRKWWQFWKKGMPTV